MKHVVYKLMFDYEKEEKWLNEMAIKGFNLEDYTFCRYLFREGKPGEYIYRIELLKQHHRNPESIAYIRFMEELGIECVAGYRNWVYFRKKASEGPFDLFSDYDSRIAHYSRVIGFVIMAFALNLGAALLNIILSITLSRFILDSINIYAGCFSLTITVIFAYLLVTYRSKLKKMKNDRKLRE